MEGQTPCRAPYCEFTYVANRVRKTKGSLASPSVYRRRRGHQFPGACRLRHCHPPSIRQPVASTSLAPALLGPAPWGQAPKPRGLPLGGRELRAGPGRAGPQGQPPPRPPGPALPRPRATDPASPRPRCSWWRIAELPAALGSQGCRSPDGSHGSSSGPGGACGRDGSLELPLPPGAAPPPGDAQSALITNCMPQPFPSPPPSPCPPPSIAALLSSRPASA